MKVAGTDPYHVIEKAELREISITDNPVQKYSVGFPVEPDGKEGGDGYDYSLVHFVASNTSGVNDVWSRYKYPVKASDVALGHLYLRPCLCSSGQNFGECCSLNDDLILSSDRIVIGREMSGLISVFAGEGVVVVVSE